MCSAQLHDLYSVDQAIQLQIKQTMSAAAILLGTLRVKKLWKQFCDFLFAFLLMEVPSEKGSTLKGENLLYGSKFLPVYSKTLFRWETN